MPYARRGLQAALPLLSCLAAAMPLHPAAAADGPRARVAEYGEYTVRSETPRTEVDPTSTGVTERVASEGARLLRRTSRVEARLCVRFGAWFAAVGTGPDGMLPIVSRLTHPVLVRPDGRSGTEETDEGVLTGTPSLSGFRFDHPWEAVPGTWTFAVLSGGKVLAEQSFEVVPPPGGAGTDDGSCDAPVS